MNEHDELIAEMSPFSRRLLRRYGNDLLAVPAYYRRRLEQECADAQKRLREKRDASDTPVSNTGVKNLFGEAQQTRKRKKRSKRNVSGYSTEYWVR